MSTRLVRSCLVLSSLSVLACAPPQLVCPDGFALTPDGRCLANDAGAAQPMTDGAPPTPDAGSDAGSDAALAIDGGTALPDAFVETPDAAMPMPDAYVELPDAYVAPDACAYGTWYADADGDGHGAAAYARSGCSQPAGYVSSSDDCNDANATVYPGAPEICDGIRNDCTSAAPDAELLHTYYVDCDGDGFAQTTAGMITTCHATPTPSCGGDYVATAPTDASNTDCDDHDATRSPTTRWYADCDGDGYAASDASPVVACLAPITRGCLPSAPMVPSLPGRWTTRSPTDQPDCWDLDARAYPGSTASSTEPMYLSTTPPSYDYNCDGANTPLITASEAPRAGAPACDGLIGLGNCRPTSLTWVGAPPLCGRYGTLYQCGAGATACVVTSQTSVQPACH